MLCTLGSLKMLPCLLRGSIIYKKFLQIPTDIFISYECQSGCELKKKVKMLIKHTGLYPKANISQFYNGIIFTL